MRVGGGSRSDTASTPFRDQHAAVLAAGDVRYGSGKRVASAVGEGAVAIQLLHRLFASESQHPPDSSPERLAIVGL
ncbi:MAG: hypothetical protein WAN44_21310 [Propionibacteriaceae bacterium]